MKWKQVRDACSSANLITHLNLGAHDAEESSVQEKEKNADLHSQHEKLRDHISSITSTLEGLRRKEKEMNEKYREQVRMSVTKSGTLCH
jgi:hypothetical protein